MTLEKEVLEELYGNYRNCKKHPVSFDAFTSKQMELLDEYHKQKLKLLNIDLVVKP